MTDVEHVPYALASGEVVPRVSDILSAFGDTDSLMGWAAYEARRGNDWLAIRDHASALGTAAHALIEATLRDTSAPELDADVWQAHEIVTPFPAWLASSGLSVRACEERVVSPTLRVGGTIDAVMIGANGIAIVDWKTSSALRWSHAVQVAAYAALWTEAHPDAPARELHLVRLCKRQRVAEWVRASVDDCGELFAAFAAMRLAYGAREAAEKRFKQMKRSVIHG